MPDPVYVEAVLLSEFDIDKGSVCRVQYPNKVGDEGYLAELMLPEGAHNHFQVIVRPLCFFCPQKTLALPAAIVTPIVRSACIFIGVLLLIVVCATGLDRVHA